MTRDRLSLMSGHGLSTRQRGHHPPEKRPSGSRQMVADPGLGSRDLDGVVQSDWELRGRLQGAPRPVWPSTGEGDGEVDERFWVQEARVVHEDRAGVLCVAGTVRERTCVDGEVDRPRTGRVGDEHVTFGDST